MKKFKRWAAEHGDVLLLCGATTVLVVGVITIVKVDAKSRMKAMEAANNMANALNAWAELEREQGAQLYPIAG